VNPLSKARQHADTKLGAYRLWATLGWAMLKTPAGRLLARVDRKFSNRGDPGGA